MFRDRTLMPAEALRLAALGILAERGPMAYAALATEVRLFTASFGGSPVDVMSSSIELLRFEGLIRTVEEADDPGNAVVELTDEGRAAIEELLQAPIKSGNAYAKLLTALKMRFLVLLPAERQAEQIEMLAEARQGELARMLDLRAKLCDRDPGFIAWLDHEIGRIETDLAWLRGIETTVCRE
jgi:DNA-binding PadR family transcriptional regulator